MVVEFLLLFSGLIWLGASSSSNSALSATLSAASALRSLSAPQTHQLLCLCREWLSLLNLPDGLCRTGVRFRGKFRRWGKGCCLFLLQGCFLFDFLHHRFPFVRKVYFLGGEERLSVPSGLAV